MKTLKRLAFISSLVMLLVAGCTKDFEEINTDPNRSVVVETGYLLTYSEKVLIDWLRDEWFGGRVNHLLAQHWSQRNYSDEDRYLFRSAVNNSAWSMFYRTMMNLQRIIDLNSNESTRVQASSSGPNDHQIAVATILQVWIMNIITDSWGDVPYSEALNPSILQPKYDKQEDVYALMIQKLIDANSMIDLSLPAPNLTKGDLIYNGNMEKWKKFGNTLRLRIALRAYHKVPAYLNDVLTLPASSFFESNADNAIIEYLPDSPNQGPVYIAFFVSARNDFTITKTLTEILAGRNDTLNVGKNNPFAGIVDPRIDVWSYPNEDDTSPYFGQYVGMPYGMLDTYTKAFAKYCPDYTVHPSVIHEPDFGYTYMDYAEYCFIMSEVNGWNQAWYEAGIRASMEFWGVATSDIDAYIAAVPAANEENVMTQKYLAFYMQPEQAWFEYRRKGYPLMLLHPGEISHRQLVEGVMTDIMFNQLEGDGIPRRLQYPIEESGVNPTGYEGAVANQGADLLTTRVWWDKP
jgi:hypothetical protein